MLALLPMPFNVCPCCGTEFGVEDRKITHSALRRAWIGAGMPWFSDIRFPAKDWSAVRQLIDGGFSADLITPVGSMTTTKTEQKILYGTAKQFWSSRELEAYSIGVGVA